MRHANDAIRDQVMRHDPMTGVFSRAYINYRVKFNTQDAFLEGDVSDDGLTLAFAHMSIRCNRSIPMGCPRWFSVRSLPILILPISRDGARLCSTSCGTGTNSSSELYRRRRKSIKISAARSVLLISWSHFLLSKRLRSSGPL
jgi:hypothetical protein